MTYDEDIFELNAKPSGKKDKKKKKTDDLLFALTSVSEDALQPASSVVDKIVAHKEEKVKKKKQKEEKALEKYRAEEDEGENTEWLDTILSYGTQGGKVKKRKYDSKDYLAVDFDEDGNVKKKKKKGKKKKGKGLTDFNKEFETEANMLRTLYVEQSKFTDSLQKKYDAMNNSKSSARGIGKFTTDLINSITTARNTQLSIVAKNMDLKKTIADLTFKEKKEFGAPDASANDNTMYASSFMKELLSNGRGNIVGASDFSDNNSVDNEVYDSEELINELQESFGDSQSDERDFIDFENMDVQVFVVVDDRGSYKFEARDKEGNVVPEYPLPNKSKMSFNKSTMIATDNYGRKYPLEVSDSDIGD